MTRPPWSGSTTPSRSATCPDPPPALAELSEIADRLGDYHLLHATRAQLLTELGDLDGARAANLRALELTDNPAEQDLLRTRIARFEG